MERKRYFTIILIFMLSIILVSAVNGEIPIQPNYISKTSISWNWSNAYPVETVSIDGQIIENFDNKSNSITANNLEPDSYHTIKIYSSTDYGFNQTNTSPENTENSQSDFFKIINKFVLAIIIIVLIVLAYSINGYFGIPAFIFSCYGIATAMNNSFEFGMLYAMLLVISIISSFSSSD